MILDDIGSLAIRVALGWLFMTGAWASRKDQAGRNFTTSETALVFKWHPELFAIAGIAILGASGLSVIFGIFPRLGALAMTIFLVPAAMIHFAKRDQAMALKGQIASALPGKSGSTAAKALDTLTVTAVFGHFTAGLKTLCLPGPTLYLMLTGAPGADADRARPRRAMAGSPDPALGAICRTPWPMPEGCRRGGRSCAIGRPLCGRRWSPERWLTPSCHPAAAPNPW